MFNLPVVPFEDVARLYPTDAFEMFVAVGYIAMNMIWEEKYRQAKTMGYRLISYVSSSATSGPNTFDWRPASSWRTTSSSRSSRSGNDIIMWGGNQVGHDTVIKDHCFIASQVVVSGNVTIEPNCFLGVNATIRDGITIARECVIGAGALISKDTKEREVYAGPQARLLKMPSNRLLRL